MTGLPLWQLECKAPGTHGIHAWRRVHSNASAKCLHCKTVLSLEETRECFGDENIDEVKT